MISRTFRYLLILFSAIGFVTMLAYLTMKYEYNKIGCPCKTRMFDELNKKGIV